MQRHEPTYKRRARQLRERQQLLRDQQSITEIRRTLEAIAATSVERIMIGPEKYIEEKITEKPREWCWKKAEVFGLWAAAIVGFLAAAVGACGIFIASSDSKQQFSAMVEQLDQMKKATVAADRESTAGRAWLFVSYDTPQKPAIDPGGIGATISFTIKNAGQSPAIITNIESHLYIRDGDKFFNVDDAPVPGSIASLQWSETATYAESSENGSFLYTKDMGERPFIPAGGVVSGIKERFTYRGKYKITSTHGAWFYCKITYKDVFMFERHTQYYVGLYGAGAEYPKGDDFNSWD